MQTASHRHRNRRPAGHGEVKKEAKRRHVQLLMLSTAKAIEELRENPEETNAILHVTC